MSSDNRRSKPNAADRAASARLFAKWQAIPAAERPSQDRIAQYLGITQSAVSQYFHGKTRLNYRAVLGFAQILRCAPTDIRTDLPEMAALPGIPEGAVTYELLRDSGWPFKFGKPRFDRLSQDERQQIENVMVTLLKEFERRARLLKALKAASPSHQSARLPKKKAGKS